MSKYKQTVIPEVDDKQFTGMRLGELKKFVKKFYNQKLKGKIVVNQHKGVTIKFGREGIRHLLYARRAGYVKLKAVVSLSEMLQYAGYSNFQNADDDDPPEILGYLNFKVKAKVEGKTQTFRIVIKK